MARAATTAGSVARGVGRRQERGRWRRGALGTTASSRPRPRRTTARARAARPPFLGVVAVAAVVGLALRIVVLVQSRWDVALGQDDAGYYARQGRLIRQGRGFIDPFAYLYTDGRLVRPSAQHPPRSRC